MFGKFFEFWFGLLRNNLVGLIQVVSALLLVVIFTVAIYSYVRTARERTERRNAIPKVTEEDRDRDGYWFERARNEFIAIQSKKIPDAKKVELLQESLAVLTRQASEITSPYVKARALMEIALAQTSCDLDLNIYATIKGITGAPTIIALRCRVLGSMALMFMRLGNVAAAQSIIDEYLQVTYENDMRLDSDENIDAFVNVVTATASSGAIGRSSLQRLFQRIETTTRRISDESLQSRSRRIIASQQARVGLKWDAIATAETISLPVEQSRAFQLIIASIARPVKTPELKEQTIEPLPTSGIWKPVTNPNETRQCIEAVFRSIAKHPDVQVQLQVLQNMASSRLMCDVEIYPLFEDEFEVTDIFDASVKGQVRTLLKEPNSPTIRAARGLKRLQDSGVITFDTAADDWNSSEETMVDVPIVPVDVKTIQSASIRQEVRLHISTAQALMTFGNRQDARDVLAKAFQEVVQQENLYYRLNHLQSIGALQVNAGDLDAARITLTNARDVYKEYTSNKSSQGMTVTESLPVEIATAQIRSRLLDDAVATTQLLSQQETRNGLLVQVIRERLRTERWKQAREVIALLQNYPHTAELQRIANSEGNAPADVSDPTRTIFNLTRNEEYASAAAVLPLVSDVAERQRLRMQIIRGMADAGRGYLGRDTESLSVRLQMLNSSLALAREQEDAFERANAIETVVELFAPGRVVQKLYDIMSAAIVEVEEIVGKENGTNPQTAEMLSRLAWTRLMLVPEERQSGTWPILTEENDSQTIADITRLLDRAIASLPENAERTLAATTYVRAIHSYGQIGQTKLAEQLIDKILPQIRELQDKEQAITLLRQLALAALKIGKTRQGFAIFTEALDTVSQVNVGTELAPQNLTVLGLRVRERVMEDIIREMLRLKLVDTAFETTTRITESVVRDRLLRMITYQAIYTNRLPLANEAVLKITSQSLRNDCLRDVNYATRNPRIYEKH
ncbi:MAG: hypothetical protein LBU65_08590 [Planctomycetaceae bacterium]|jgi:tetratricopeptide (TPR) repeat protein|nr:hypothetical protein [Planctomycetaceae bacterium]